MMYRLFCFALLLFSSFSAFAVSDNSAAHREAIKKELNERIEQKRLQQYYSNQKIVCNTKIIVTKPRTVSFYGAKVAGANYIGTTGVGQWLNDSRVCLLNKPIVAVAWDEKGKPHRYFSSKDRKQLTYNNLNKTVVVQFPRDFAKAPQNDTSVLCRVQLLNASKSPVDFYAGKRYVVSKIGQFSPWQKQLQDAPCFKNQRVLARIMVRSPTSLTFYRYKSKKIYSDINQVPTVVFPTDFDQQRTITIPLTRELLLLFG